MHRRPGDGASSCPAAHQQITFLTARWDVKICHRLGFIMVMMATLVVSDLIFEIGSLVISHYSRQLLLLLQVRLYRHDVSASTMYYHACQWEQEDGSLDEEQEEGHSILIKSLIERARLAPFASSHIRQTDSQSRQSVSFAGRTSCPSAILTKER